MNQIDALMLDYSGEGRLQPAGTGDRLKPVLTPGASVLVVRDGKVLVRKSYGMANLEDRIAATPQTNYRLASMTKQFTAACILLLAERGKLSLDDPIVRVIPSGGTADCADGAVMTRPLTRREACPERSRRAAPSPRFAGRGISHEVLLSACGEKVALSDADSERSEEEAESKGRMRGVVRSREDGEGSPSPTGSLAPLGMTLPAYMQAITIRHLLTHTSGLLAYEDLIPPGTTRQVKDADVLNLLAQQSTTYFAPGTHYRYSNTGYAFLALIVERVSGQRFADFLHDNIFKPAGMSNTVAFEEGVSTVAHRAYGYSRSKEHWTRTDQSLTSAVLGDGGIYTSINDLEHWIAWLESGRFDQALVPATQTDDPNVRYGFGWRISEHRGLQYVWHSGETIGFRNAIVRFPKRHLSVVVLTNRDEGTPQQIALDIADVFLSP